MLPKQYQPPRTIDLLRLIDVLDKGNLLGDYRIGPKVEKALRGNPAELYQYLQEHPEILDHAKATIFIEGKRKEENPFYPPPLEPDQIARLTGPLKLGYYNPRRDILGINPEMLNLNVLNVGRTRSGKSNLNLIVLDQLLQMQLSFNIIIIDLKKEYRCLLPRHQNLKIITFKNLRFNPLEVPAWQDPKDHINNFAEVFCRENYILAFGKNMLISCLEYLYGQWGVFTDKRIFPTFRDLYNIINAQKGGARQNDAKASLLSRLRVYVAYPEIFCCKGFPFKVFLDNHLSIELESIPNEMYATVVNLICSLIYNYYLKSNLRGSTTRTLFVVDEATVLFDATRDRNIQYGDSYINTIVRRGGEFGLGFWVTSQEPSTLSQAVHSNTSLKLMFPLTEAQQLYSMAKSLALSAAQVQFFFKLPSRGTCIARYNEYPDPLILDVPHYTEEKAVSDDFIQNKMKDFYDTITPKEQTVPQEITTATQITTTIPEDALILLQHIADHAFDNYTTHRDSCSLEKHKVDKAREWLEKNSFISVEYIKTTKGRSRPACFLVLEDKAWKKIDIKQHHGKGGFKHQLYCHLIKEHLEQDGWAVRIDKPIYPSQKLIDVVAEKEGGTIGYEVTIHFANLHENIEKDMKDLEHLVIIIEDKDLKKAEEEVKKCSANISANKRIDIATINSFFK